MKTGSNVQALMLEKQLKCINVALKNQRSAQNNFHLTISRTEKNCFKSIRPVFRSSKRRWPDFRKSRASPSLSIAIDGAWNSSRAADDKQNLSLDQSVSQHSKRLLSNAKDKFFERTLSQMHRHRRRKKEKKNDKTFFFRGAKWRANKAEKRISLSFAQSAFIMSHISRPC